MRNKHFHFLCPVTLRDRAKEDWYHRFRVVPKIRQGQAQKTQAALFMPAPRAHFWRNMDDG